MPDDVEGDDLPSVDRDPTSQDDTTNWTTEELNTWFEESFGGMDNFKRQFPDRPQDIPDLELSAAVDSYYRLTSGLPEMIYSEPHWTILSNDVKAAFRRGWERRRGPKSPDWQTPLSEKYHATEELTYRPGGQLESDDEPVSSLGVESDSDIDDDRPPVQYDPSRVVDPAEHRYSRRMGLSPGALVGVAVGVVGFLVVGGLILSDGSDNDESVTAPSTQPRSEEPAEPTPTQPPVESTAAPPEQAATESEDDPQSVAVADVADSAFPSLWNFTATKTETIVSAPDFISATPVGAVLPWSVAVSEACTGDTCNYTSTVRPLIAEAVISEIPATPWVVDGPNWSLDVVWATGQSSVATTVCVISKHWTYDFTVTEAEVIDGRSAAVAFEGTWIQRDRLDLAASTGDLAICGEPWELVDEWALVGTAG